MVELDFELVERQARVIIGALRSDQVLPVEVLSVVIFDVQNAAFSAESLTAALINSS